MTVLATIAIDALNADAIAGVLLNGSPRFPVGLVPDACSLTQRDECRLPRCGINVRRVRGINGE